MTHTFPITVCLALLCIFLLTVQTAAQETEWQYLPEGNWTVDSYMNESDTLVQPLPDARITATFTNGTLIGSSGCNTYRTEYTAAGGGIIILPAASTKMACQSEYMKQEQEFLKTLTKIALIQRNETHMILMDDDEEEFITLISAKNQDIPTKTQ